LSPDSPLLKSLTFFLARLDECLPLGEKTVLYVGGGAAVLLAFDGKLGTVDVDFIGEKTGVLQQLSEVAGKGSELHRETEYYVDVVPPGLFPQEWGWRDRARTVDVPGVARIELKTLELHDLILSKLRRFGGKDRQDVRDLCDRSEFDVEILRARYAQARLRFDRDEREKIDENFHYIEREILAVDRTVFD